MHDTMLTDVEAPRTVFAQRSPFYQELRRRIDDHFARTRQSIHCTPAMVLKTVVLVSWFAVSYGLFLAFGDRLLWCLACAASTALAMAGLGMNVQHDGSHKAYSARRWVNRTTALALDWLGGSSYIWRWQHNVLHHTYPNVDGLDHDIDLGGIARLAPSQRWRWFHGYQHIYLWALYSLTAVKWQLVDDYKMLITGRVGDYPFPRPRGRDLWFLVLGKVAFFSWAIVLPVAVHGPATALLFYLVCQAITGLVLSVTFQLAHCIEDVTWEVPPEGRRIEAEWALHQIATTRNFSRSNRLLSWYIGGLNYQIEHHLFPGICHVHYPRIAGIVQTLCRERGVSYRGHESVVDALRSHYRWLKRMGAAVDSAA